MNHLLNYWDCYIELHKFNDEGISCCDTINYMSTELRNCVEYIKDTIETWDKEKNDGYEIVSWTILECKL